MKDNLSKVLFVLFIASFLLISAPAAMAIGSGDGNILKRSTEDTCQACHKTNVNTPSPGESNFVQANWDNAIKMHSAEIIGSCSNTSYATKTVCEAKGGTWTPTKWNAAGGWGVTGGQYGLFGCTTCHTPHGTKNLMLIKELITPPSGTLPGGAVDFRAFSGTAGSAPYALGDDTGGHSTSTRACEICHSKTKFHNYDTANNSTNGGDLLHYNAVDCSTCHSHKTGFKPGACNTCHGSSGSTGAPLVSGDLVTGANATGSTDVGKHQKHNVDLGYGCTTCHTSYVMPNSGNIDIGFNNFGSGGGSYVANSSESYTGRNGTTIGGPATPGKTCSSIYCHSDVQGASGVGNPANYRSPVWLSTESAMTCGSCHENMSSSGSATGSHIKHAQTYNMSCANCHTGYTSGTTNSSLHVNHTIDVAISTTYGGTYSGGTTPGDNAPGGGYGSCSTSYCHSDGKATPTTYQTPSWGGSANCGTCHGANDTAPPASTPHTKHVGTAGYKFYCAKCHNNTVNSTADSTTYATIKSTALHVDKQRQVAFDTGAGTWNGTSCDAVYCHSKGTGGTDHVGDNRPVQMQTTLPTWSGTMSCNSCHGGGNANGKPEYASGNPKANSHSAHTNYTGDDCSVCHNATTTDGTTITTKSNHANKTYNVNAKSGYSFTYAYDVNGGTCSSISCHGGAGKNATWGSSVACGGCHDAPPTTLAHTTHTSALNSSTAAYGSPFTDSPSSGAYGYNCGECHPLSIGSHGNGSVEVDLSPTGAPGSSMKAKNQGGASYSVTPGTTQNGTCSGVYCHSDGSNGSSSNFVTSPAWNTSMTATNKCGQCHDNPPQYAGQSHYTATGFMGKEGGHLVGLHFDNIYSGSSGLASAGTGNTNSHGNSAYSTAMSCYICHEGEVSSSTVDTYALNNLGSSAMKCGTCHTGGTPTPLQNGLITDKTRHVNGSKDVVIASAFTMKSKAQLRAGSMPSVWARNVGYKTAGAYDSATLNTSDWNSGSKTCTTACHNNQPVTWGSTTVTCNSCHIEL